MISCRLLRLPGNFPLLVFGVLLQRPIEKVFDIFLHLVGLLVAEGCTRVSNSLVLIIGGNKLFCNVLTEALQLFLGKFMMKLIQDMFDVREQLDMLAQGTAPGRVVEHTVFS